MKFYKIWDTERQLFFKGGQLTANYPITFTEVVPTTKPKVRYEIPNQSQGSKS